MKKEGVNGAIRKSKVFILIAVALTMGCSKKDPAPKPVAAFSFTVGSNGQVVFKNSSTNSTSYSWDFGDGSPNSNLENPTYSYQSNDTFTVTLTATGTGGSATATNSVAVNNVSGKLTFWNSTPFYCGSSIKVTIGNTSSTITKIGGSSAPNCGDSGYATFDLLAGKYNYTATCGSLSWSGDVSVSGGCNIYDFPAGTATFYTTTNLGCGIITVNLSGLLATIIGPNPSAACLDYNSAIYILPPGVYDFTASCSNGTWGSNITITKGGCSKMQLTN